MLCASPHAHVSTADHPHEHSQVGSRVCPVSVPGRLQLGGRGAPVSPWEGAGPPVVGPQWVYTSGSQGLKWAKDLNKHLTKWLTDGKQAREKRDHVIRHQGSANQSSILVALHTQQNGPNPERWCHQSRVSTRTARSSHHCWWECKTVQSCWKTVWQFLRK